MVLHTTSLWMTYIPVAGTGISGTLVGGPTPVAGKVGQALSIGPGQYIDFGDQSANCAGNIALCTNGGGQTVAFWFKLMAIGWISVFDNNGGMRLYLQKSGNIILTEMHCVLNGAGYRYSTSRTVSNVNDWHQITVSMLK